MGYSKEEQKKNREKWIAALRSGKYKQGKGCLFDGENHCCLAVASEVYAEDTGNGKFVLEDGGYYFVEGNSCSKNYLIASVMDYFGLSTMRGDFKTNVETEYVYYKNLSSINDNGKTFEEIADVIESEPEGLCITS